jgi:hypothetical protein
MSILYIAARLITKRWLPQVPGPIVVVALTILATRLWELHNYGIALIDQFRRASCCPHSPLRGPAGSDCLCGVDCGSSSIPKVRRPSPHCFAACQQAAVCGRPLSMIGQAD